MRRDRRAFFFWAAVALGFLGASWAARSHAGGYNNVLLPAYAALSALLALGAHSLQTALARRPTALRRLAAALVSLLCLFQLARLAYDPRRQVPSLGDRRAGEELIALIELLPGEVYLPYHGYLPTLAGKRSYAHAMAVWDVARGTNQRATDALIGEIVGAIRRRRFSAVIVDTDTYAQPDLDLHYTRHPIAFEEDAFYPVTGLRLRPRYVYLPKSASSPSLPQS